MDGTDFPHDLLQTQHAWNATYRALAAPCPAMSRRCAAVCSGCLYVCGGTRIWTHGPAGRKELRRQGRVLERQQ
ncbi:hypothetical protein ACIA6D_43105 [Streptomyces cacaoi]|uniref:hypothetical protein n=1 Tax=Streptomyces cacaoi TaxID=1898 RepID=UPI003748B6FB